jgi:ABC-type transport system involved in cytochrome bd biosynthesis fused ATPase/permease subunit
VTVLGEIRARGTFREPPFVDLGIEHVPFDELTDQPVVEQPLLEAVRAGSSGAVIGVRGGGKSSVLAWLCRNLPADHIPIRVPLVGMDDPSDPRRARERGARRSARGGSG